MRATIAPGWARAGFSLIELVIVIVILGIIAAIAIPRMSRGASNAEENATKASLRGVRNALEMYKAELGSYPNNHANVQNDLTRELVTAGGITAGPYLHTIPVLTLATSSGHGSNEIAAGVPMGPSYLAFPTAVGWGYVPMDFATPEYRGHFYANGSTDAQRNW